MTSYVNWVINTENGNTSRWTEAARQAGHAILLMDPRSYAFGALENPEAEDLTPAPIFKEEPVLAYGGTDMVRALQPYAARENVGWYPLAWAPWADLRCSAYLKFLAPLSIQRSYGFYTLAQLADERTQREVYAAHGCDDLIFLRPDDGWKSFSGHLVPRHALPKQVAELLRGLPPETRCLAAMPATIRREWRCFLVGNRVVSASRYLLDGSLRPEPGCPAEVENFASRAEEAWLASPPACVIDVAETKAGLHVVEVGPVHCSWLYACDEHVIVRELADLAVARAREREPGSYPSHEQPDPR